MNLIKQKSKIFFSKQNQPYLIKIALSSFLLLNKSFINALFFYQIKKKSYRFLLFGILCYPITSYSQVMPYQDMFFWFKDDIEKNQIKKIEAYEFTNLGDSIIIDSNITKGELLTEEHYDNSGRIIIKKNHYPYSDIEYKKREITYLGNRVGTFKLYTNTKLERVETYSWNNDVLDLWHIKTFDNNQEQAYTKQIGRNMLEKPTNELIKMGNKILNNDTLIYVGNATIRFNKASKKQIDSTLIYPSNSDTVYKSEIFVHGKLIYKEIHRQKNNILTQRIEEFQKGEFHRVYYRKSENGRVIVEKQIHKVANLNYDKFYYYHSNGTPIRKEVYKNSSLPETVVYYKILNY